MFVLIAFGIEFVLFNLGGRWLTPNLLLLVVLFFNFYRGIRYSLVAAVFAGILQDSFSVYPVGIHVFSFVICAFGTTIVRRYFFHVSPYSFRVLMAGLLSILNVIVLYLLHIIFTPIVFWDILGAVLLPEVLLTTMVSSFVFRNLKKCVLKFSV